jgi:hypothetical protein
MRRLATERLVGNPKSWVKGDKRCLQDFADLKNVTRPRRLPMAACR